MSWSAFVDTTTNDIADAEIVPSPADLDGPPREQFEAARAAAVQLVEAGAVGVDKPIRVTLSGHANPGHEPTEGWANDVVTVGIAQIT